MDTIKKPLLKDIAYQQIKEKIMLGHYLEKNITSENELVEELQMSRTPIREALQRLQYEGLVKIFSNQGIVIQELSLKDTRDIFDLRLAIESYALQTTIEVITERNFLEINEIIEKQQEANARKDPYVFMQLDSQFHNYLLEIADNDIFIQIMSNIRDRFFYHGYRIMNKNPDRIKQSLEEHILIIQALEKKDLESAIQNMNKHLVNGRKTIMGY